ncbi:antibiotic biosynthesis monooxygenase [Streptomyces sp. 891-h]|uniref:antibiotic biosynthesis monooxygenase family protein n=1 Tax=unclassified Streptomyces TaxID=2593676 RepID=UPI001FA9ABC0|nr:antibiotic biosynthesis monooxygenase [Streptomyces sp. 891-h]UNZ19502.1 antibiotic biosynthesis monooxygenase [Streptomyces sp. 891-h]
MSIVKINALTVPADQREVLEQRFAARKGFVESADGFEWFELLRPLEGSDRYLVYTRWRDEESFQAWMNGPMKEAHQRAKGADSGTEGKPADSGAEAGGERPKPAATDSETWSFEVVQQAPPKK